MKGFKKIAAKTIVIEKIRKIKVQDIYENPSFNNPYCERLHGKVVWHITGWENGIYRRIDMPADEVIVDMV